MRNFAEQSLDIARNTCIRWLDSFDEECAVVGADGQPACRADAGHFANAFASCAALLGKRQSQQSALVDAAARCIAAQFYYASDDVEGCVHAALALLALGLNRSKNPAWEQFPESIRSTIGRWMRANQHCEESDKIFAIARCVAASAMGFGEGNESDKKIEQYINDLLRSPSDGFVNMAKREDDCRYDASGLERLIFIRELLQRYPNVYVRERRLPALRSCMQKYLRLLPMLVQGDGSVWNYGEPSGCLGTVYSCTAIIESLSDSWIETSQRATYIDLLHCCFRHFFFQYVNQEDGSLCLSNEENGISPIFSVARANFAVAHQLTLWAKYAETIKETFQSSEVIKLQPGGRFFSFSTGRKKEQGLLIYRDDESKLAFQLPLIDCDGTESCAFLAYPHCSGIFEAPVGKYLPILVPELQIEDRLFTPSFFGKSISSGIGRNREFQWRYEQPDLVDTFGNVVGGISSCKVQWSFCGTKVRAEFLYAPKKLLQMQRFRYVVAIVGPRPHLLQNGIPQLDCSGEPFANIIQDDFQGDWQPPIDVSGDADMRTNVGKIQYLLSYSNTRQLPLQAGRTYRFSVELKPKIVTS